MFGDRLARHDDERRLRTSAQCRDSRLEGARRLERRARPFDDEQAVAVVVALQTAPSTVLGLAEAAERLSHSCRRLIWLNPLLRYAGFQPRAAGIRALLPHVHEHRQVHNLNSLRALVATLSAPAPNQGRSA